MSEQSTEQPPGLSETMHRVVVALEEGFVFRKLGLCYDYRASPKEFPRKTLPTANETKQNKPDACARGSGMAECARNGALLFDGYLLRLESGFAGSGEERVFDRLIGGLIRIATTAPKGYLARGLTPDGRGYYGWTDPDSHLFWAFAAWRAVHTAAIAPESQDKLKNIVGKWIQRLQRDKFAIPALAGKPPVDEPLDRADAETGAKLLAMLAVAAEISGDANWAGILEEKANEVDKARLAAPFAGEEVVSPQRLLAVQLAYLILGRLDPDEDRRALVRERALEIGRRATPHLDAWRKLDPAILEETPELDWRAAQTGKGEPFVFPESWRRIDHERETVAATMQAALTILLAREAELAAEHAPQMRAALQEIPWEKIWLAAAIAPALSVHARGVELELWEAELLDYSRSDCIEESLVRPYLAEDFDEKHPEKAGHSESPAKPEEEKPKKRRRRRRKKSNR